MKFIDYTDAAGCIHHVAVRTDKDDPRQGIPFDPPDVGKLGLPDAQRVALHNALVERRLFTWRDVVVQQDSITAALRTLAARGVLPADQIGKIKRQLVLLYRQEGNTK